MSEQTPRCQFRGHADVVMLNGVCLICAKELREKQNEAKRRRQIVHGADTLPFYSPRNTND